MAKGKAELKFPASELTGEWTKANVRPKPRVQVTARARDGAGVYLLPFRVYWDGARWCSAKNDNELVGKIEEWKA